MLDGLTGQYFAFVAKRFPVMCASDEFHFLPMAGKAAEYYDRLDSLDAGSIQDTINELRQFRIRFSDLKTAENIGIEDQVDLEMLIANISGFLIEFETKESYRNNPLLYLKIAFIGLDHALNKPAESSKERTNRTVSRLDAIPSLLNQGIENLSLVPESYYGHAVSMVTDCKDYLRSCPALLDSETDRRASLEMGLDKAVEAVEKFGKFLLSGKPCPDSDFSTDTLEASIREHFICPRSLDDIFQIAEDDWNDNLKNLKDTAKRISPDIPWQDLYHLISPADMGNISIISRYNREAEGISSFFLKNGLIDKNDCSVLAIAETPGYLRSVRGSASFSAALTADRGEADYFHITTKRVDRAGAGAGKRLVERLHKEYRFLTAHETVPGHFFLDSRRRNLKNPVRRQIESPLFYEGWASYAETLLVDYGYVIEPEDRLIDFRRRLWRAARCQIDIGSATGKLDRDRSVELLKTVGFTGQEAVSQIDRFRLNPGYQLCYCLGSYEIKELKERYMTRLGAQRFHGLLLEGGEVPFHRIEQRLKNMLN